VIVIGPIAFILLINYSTLVLTQELKTNPTLLCTYLTN